MQQLLPTLNPKVDVLPRNVAIASLELVGRVRRNNDGLQRVQEVVLDDGGVVAAEEEFEVVEIFDSEEGGVVFGAVGSLEHTEEYIIPWNISNQAIQIT